MLGLFLGTLRRIKPHHKASVSVGAPLYVCPGMCWCSILDLLSGKGYSFGGWFFLLYCNFRSHSPEATRIPTVFFFFYQFRFFPRFFFLVLLLSVLFILTFLSLSLSLPVASLYRFIFLVLLFYFSYHLLCTVLAWPLFPLRFSTTNRSDSIFVSNGPARGLVTPYCLKEWFLTIS